MVAALDPLRELDLLRSGQQVDLADVAQEELQRVGRDLARLGDRVLLVRRARVDDLDVDVAQRLVEIVDLSRVEVELAEADRDLLGRQRPRFLRRLEQRARLVGVEDPGHLGSYGIVYSGLPTCAHPAPPWQ